jgi:DNA-binding NtrC family response regulator
MGAGIRAALVAAGMHVTPFHVSATHLKYGIICFNRISDELIAALNSADRFSCRVLAIAVGLENNALPVWQLLHAGASDALTWDMEGVAAKQISAKINRWAEVDGMTAQASAQGLFVGESPAWRSLVRSVIEAAHYTMSPILLTGESGTGKELLARLVSAVPKMTAANRGQSW